MSSPAQRGGVEVPAPAPVTKTKQTPERATKGLSAIEPSHSGHVPTPSRFFGWKGAIDRSLAVMLLVPGLPLLGLLIVIIRVTSRGPGVYRQVRVGRNGRAYTMYKLRTMRCDAEAGTGPVWTQAKDPRVTGVGRIFRKLHLDEIPQLFNVLRGEMSLIGPRPERPEFVKVLSDAIPDYPGRLAVRPGITGLAQINLPPDSDLASVRRKVVLDVQYIQQANLWMDVRILLATSLRIVGCPGIIAARVTRLRRHVEVDPVETSQSSTERLVGSEATPDRLLGQLDAISRVNGNGHARRNGHQINGKHRDRIESTKPDRPNHPK